jgi:hypothetical protein
MKHRVRIVLLFAALTTAELGVATAEAGMITWHWSGPVTGYLGDGFGGPTLDTIVPLGTD